MEELSEEDARRVLDLLAHSEPREADGELTLDRIRELLKDRPGIHVPPPGAPAFSEFEPVRCPGTPASELLISDRR